MSNFGLAVVKESGGTIAYGDAPVSGGIPQPDTQYLEFPVEKSRMQEVLDHLRLIGIDLGDAE